MPRISDPPLLPSKLAEDAPEHVGRETRSAASSARTTLSKIATQLAVRVFVGFVISRRADCSVFTSMTPHVESNQDAPHVGRETKFRREDPNLGWLCNYARRRVRSGAGMYIVWFAIPQSPFPALGLNPQRPPR